jgi:hypothetical protein
MDRQFVFRGETVVIREQPSSPAMANAAHGGGARGTMTGAHSDPTAAEIVVGGHVVPVHRMEDGSFHTHALPFVTFRSIEDAARSIVNMIAVEPSQDAYERTTVPVPLHAREVDYALRGNFLEFCDCYTVCPCWVDRAPDDGTCTGVFAWVVTEGTIDGLDVSGHTAVSVSTHEGHRESAQQRVMLFVDDDTSEAQAQALAGAFCGRFGGPLGELSSLLGTMLGVERAKIDVQWGTCGSQLTVGRRIAADAVNNVGSTGKVTTLSDGRLSTVLGTPAEVGVARRLRIGLPEQGIDLDLRGRSAMRGHFRYRNDLSSR